MIMHLNWAGRTTRCAAAVFGVALMAMLSTGPAAQQQPEDGADQWFIQLLLGPEQELDQTLALIEENWKPTYVAMALDILSLARQPSLRTQLINLIEQKTQQTWGSDIDAAYRWIWNTDESRHPHYAQFKSKLYRLLDPKFQRYFDDGHADTIRLDEVRWGGVKQDGIPPLRQPKMLPAAQASYLSDTDVVFGIALNGDVRAYPKRILAWHEMFVDEIGGQQYAGVYCTLCGAVILYETMHAGVDHQLGTSGFLYRSNKLMYDQATQSLWSTTRGEPVIGPLVGRGIVLQRSFLVTTSWGEWRRRHPQTQVLSLDTGHRRDYAEGVAYQNYFASDELMFTVPTLDTRLNNKDEVLALTFPRLGEQTLAIHEAYLRNNPIYYDSLSTQEFVVLTDKSGANRVYESSPEQFREYDQQGQLKDENGQSWQLTEAALVAEDDTELKRLPAHRAFWFGWYAAHNDTRLVF